MKEDSGGWEDEKRQWRISERCKEVVKDGWEMNEIGDGKKTKRDSKGLVEGR
jgi:hypothetical protein